MWHIVCYGAVKRARRRPGVKPDEKWGRTANHLSPAKKTAKNGLKTARPEINLTRNGRRKAEVEGD
jgi:hypothetical protein